MPALINSEGPSLYLLLTQTWLSAVWYRCENIQLLPKAKGKKEERKSVKLYPQSSN